MRILILLPFTVLNLQLPAQGPFRSAHAIFRADLRAAFIPAPEGADRLRPRLGVNIHSLKDDRALDLAADAGFSFVRTDLLRVNLEKQGHHNFAAFDDLMRSLETRGMGVLWVLAYGNPEHGGESPQSDAEIATYARYAAAAVAHFLGQCNV